LSYSWKNGENKRTVPKHTKTIQRDIQRTIREAKVNKKKEEILPESSKRMWENL